MASYGISNTIVLGMPWFATNVSDMFVPLYLHFTVAFKFECSHLINYPFIMTQVACVLKTNRFWIMACSPYGTKPLCKTRAHDDVIKWKHSPRCWPFVRGIHRSPVNSPHGTSDTELWCFLWFAPEKNSWVYNRQTGDLRRHLTRNDVNVMWFIINT